MLGLNGKKLLKSLHLIFGAGAFGGIVALLILIRAVPATSDTAIFIKDLGAYRLFNLLVTWSFYGIILTGLLFSLFTSWKFFRYYWIIVKWLLVAVLFAVVWFWLGPAINGAVSVADSGRETGLNRLMYEGYTVRREMLIIGMLFIMLIVVLISVLKPWGKRSLNLNGKRSAVLWSWGIGAFLLAVFATFGYINLQEFRTMEIREITFADLEDGIYLGTSDLGGFAYQVEVEILEHAIKQINIVNNRASDYARFAEGVIPRIIRRQTANVDAITGATTTSKCLMKAVENALTQPQLLR